MDEILKGIYIRAFDRALRSADDALELMRRGHDGDKELTENYRSACSKIKQITDRWTREGYGELHGSLLINAWFDKQRMDADGVH